MYSTILRAPAIKFALATLLLLQIQSALSRHHSGSDSDSGSHESHESHESKPKPNKPCVGPDYTNLVFGPAIYQLTEPVLHGEGPTWDPRTNRLYFVDIQNGKIFSYNPETGKTYFITLDGTVSPVVQSKKNPKQFYVGLNLTLVKITWDGVHEVESIETLTTVSQQFPTSRFNDGKADKRGRLWFGTMGYEDASGVAPNAGALYFITKKTQQNPLAIISPVNVSNGLAWNRENNKFYYIDTPTYNIMEYDYEDDSGKISNPRVVINMLEHLGYDAYPDGMTIDENNNLWVALHGAGAIVHVNSKDGTIISKIAMPAQYVTSCMWGGRDLDILFVTTSRVKLNAIQRLQQPATGSLFAIRNLGTRGLPVYGGDI